MRVSYSDPSFCTSRRRSADRVKIEYDRTRYIVTPHRPSTIDYRLSTIDDRKPLPRARRCAILLGVWLTRFEPLERAALWIWRKLPLSWRGRSALYWLISTKYGIGVQGLVFDDAGRVLLLRHTYKGRYAWGLPGGGMGRGETPAAAMVREVREEAGLDVTISRLLGVEAHPSRLIVEIFY